MWNSPTQEQLAQTPNLYTTQHIPVQQKIIHLHLFLGSADFFIAECDEAGETCFGLTILPHHSHSEWGYMSMKEMNEVNIGGFQIDNDIYWTPCPANEVRTICRARGWELVQPNKYMANMTA